MSKQFAVFKIGKDNFCIDINKITYIESFQDITQVPNAPQYIEGVINIHSNIIAVYNLHKKFRLEQVNSTDDTVFIIVDIDGVGIGLIADDVDEIITAEDSQIEATPVVMSVGLQYISGVIKRDKDIIMIIDVDKLISLEEQEQIENILKE